MGEFVICSMTGKTKKSGFLKEKWDVPAGVPTAKVMGIQRLRDNIDGPGIRSLVLFNTCPLECEYCLNKMMMRSGIEREFTPEHLYEALLVDTTYFEISEGGVTFGGGEPALQVDFIEKFAEIVKDRWSIILETSLNVPWQNVMRLASFVDYFIVDIKDMNPSIYYEYTQHPGFQAYDNLEWLVRNGHASKIRVRVPLIPDYNTEEDQAASIEKLKAMGVEVEPFTYIKTRKREEPLELAGVPSLPDDPEPLLGDIICDPDDLVGELTGDKDLFSGLKPRKVKRRERKEKM